MESLSVAISIIGIGKELLTLIFGAYKSLSTTAAPLRKELERFHSDLFAYINNWEDISAHIASSGFTPKALDKLIREMQELTDKAKDLFKRPCHLKKDDIQRFRDNVMTTFQLGMLSVVSEAFERMEQKMEGLERIERKVERMAEKPAVQIIQQIIIIQEQALDNPKLKEQKKAESVEKEKLEMTDSEAAMKESVEKEKLEMTDFEAAMKESQAKEDNKKNNPNLSMSLTSDVPGTVHLDLSTQNCDGMIEVTLKGPPDVVTAMIGESPMKVSEKLGHFYFEVGLVEMVELSGTSKTCTHAGVGVGLATPKKFRNDKMVGWYSESFGYDGRMGEVYSEHRPQEPFRMGILAKGDTLGIGLHQLPRQRPIIFFVKNGVFQGCTQKHRLKRSSIDHLHPVITLVSRCTKLCVNFHGPFHLPSDLLSRLRSNGK